MKTICIIQARLGSTRLPGKVLMNLGGHHVLEWCHRACAAAPGCDEVWIATTTLPQDDAIEAFCDDHGFFCWRGSEMDVLSRFMGCATASNADIILRITGDEPFVDPNIIGAVIRLQKITGSEFVTNVSPRTFGDGLDVQLMTRHALICADREATRPLDRDGVCTWIERNRSRFPAETVINPIPGQQNERWVLDTAADFEFCKALVEYWPWSKGPPSQLDILGVLDANPDLRKINAGHVCNERYFEGLAEEPLYARTYDRSQAQFKKARKVIPLAAQTFSKSFLQYPQPSPLFLSHGQGGLVWDVDGAEFVDLVSALLPNILGYRDPDVDAAIRRQLSSGISFSLATELEAELAETLCRLIPSAEMVKFAKNGSDVNVAAVRIARAFTKRDRILTCDQYHGWGDSLLAGSDRGLGIPKALADLTTRVPFGDTQSVASELASEDYAAVIVEPTHDPNFLNELRSLTVRHGTVLIFDEIVTGWRWGIGCAQGHWGITPDLTSIGKALGNGAPISVIVGRRPLMALMEPPNNIFFSSTFGGETLSIAAALATLKKLERENVPQSLRDKAARLRKHALKVRDDLGIAFAFTMDDTPLARMTFARPEWQRVFSREMISSGTLIVASNNLCHAHGESELRRVEKSYAHAIARVADEIDAGVIS